MYRNPVAEWANYDKIFLDPVTFWGKRESLEQGITREELQTLVNNFYVLIYQELSRDYEMVAGPGSNTLRLQVALTKVKESAEELDTVSTNLPPVVGVQQLLGTLTGRPVFTGEASIES